MLRISQLKTALKPRDRKSIPHPLPVELWIEILKIAIYSDLPISETCTSNDFPQLLCKWGSMPMTYQRYHQLKDPSIHDPTTENLRLVCWTWFHIVQNICKRCTSQLPAGHPARFIAANGRIINSLPILDKMADLEDSFSLIKPYPLQEDLLSFGLTVSTLLVSHLDLWRVSVHSDHSALSFLVKYSQYFPNLRSLSLEDYTIDLQFFVELEKGFPQLTSFQLSRCCLKTGFMGPPSLRLPNLEIAEFDVKGYLPNCFFPALRHLSLHSNSQPDQYTRLLDNHWPQLDTLIDRTNPSFLHFSWDHDLTLLEATTWVIQCKITAIRRGSSGALKGAWIFNQTDITLETIKMILESPKETTLVTIVTRQLSPRSLQYITRGCKKRGIKFVELAGMESSRRPDLPDFPIGRMKCTIC